ncbi:MAG TPA: twin-arginine translocase TatA/TatE family subunit [Actinomycetota bacterium]|nr:twin-arginine translocase TatA/TatE family subunit [Actinomycetota bacterium]
MFDIGLGEFLVLGLLALLVFGPDRLPTAAASAGRFVAKARQTLGQAKSQISESADLDSVGQDLQSLADLHPRRMLASLTDPAPSAKPRSSPTDPPVDPNAT